MTKLASIDVGSNTVRLLILQTGLINGSVHEVDSARRITRLGEGMDAKKRLAPKTMEATLQVLEEFREIYEKHGGVLIRAVATSAVREAENKEEFLKKVLERTGIAVEVISGEEEARLTLEGALWKISHDNREILTFDIGGGSSEFILSRGREIAGSLSAPLGAVRLTEKFISRHPVPAGDYEKLTAHIRSELSSIKNQLPALHPELAIGTAGTVTTLAALDQSLHPYDPEKIHNASLPLHRIQSLQDDLKAMSIDERLRLKPLEKGREDLIIAGTALVLETLRAFGRSELLVSEYSLREGIILSSI